MRTAVRTTRDMRLRRHRRVRGKIAGTAGRPRLAVFRSNRGIFAQLVDDSSGRTLAGASWVGLKDFKGDKSAQAKEFIRHSLELKESFSSAATAAKTLTKEQAEALSAEESALGKIKSQLTTFRVK